MQLNGYRRILVLGLWFGTATLVASQRSVEVGGGVEYSEASEAILTRGDGPHRPRIDQTIHEPGREELGILFDRPRIKPTQVDVPPVIDGRLDDPVWRTVTLITDFVQQSPLDGVPATEDTEVYLAYDSEHLYFGFYLHYDDPGLMRANQVDRDQASQDDLITVYFDTFLNQQRVYDFDLNAYNVQGDGVITSGSFMTEAIPFADRSWDALFYSGTQIVADGYTAEMAIPFKSLRYPQPAPGMPHRWGFQIVREIKGKGQENDVWAPMSREVQSFMAQMGVLEGMTDLSTSRNIEILPTFTAIRAEQFDLDPGGLSRTTMSPEAGLNLKYGLSSDLTADFTLNPDFSQIESDSPQIANNQRYPLLFKELRPFFLEGADIFNFTSPIDLVHTRNIIAPRVGAKLTGKAGRTTLGMLVADDEAPGLQGDVTDSAFGETAKYFVGRLRYDLHAESYIGTLFTNREFLDGFSRVGGVDAQLRINQVSRLNFMAYQSTHRDLEGIERTGPMSGALYSRDGKNLQIRSLFGQIDPDFRTDVGFVRRVDQRFTMQLAGYRWFPEHWVLNWGPSVRYERIYNFSDVLEDEIYDLSVQFKFARNIEVNLSGEKILERFGGVNFRKSRGGFETFVNSSRSFSLGVQGSWGDEIFFDPETPFLGRQTNIGMKATIRPWSGIQSTLSLDSARFTDASIDSREVFDVKIGRGVTTWKLSERFLLRNITEYNTFSTKLDFNLLLTYRVNAGTVFYFGYDDHYRQEEFLEEDRYFASDLRRTNRAIFTKLQYLFRY